MPKKSAPILKINNTEIQIEIADELSEQIQGLSGRASLCAACGMLFTYHNAQIRDFWMKDMRFSLDFVFIRDGLVVEMLENAPKPVADQPIFRIQSRNPADMVLEVNAGFVKKNGIAAGDKALVFFTEP